MDLSYVVRYYIEKMLKEVTGMKAMLLDSETTRIVSTVYSQSEILEQEVYLVEKLGSDPGEQLLHLKVRTKRRQLQSRNRPAHRQHKVLRSSHAHSHAATCRPSAFSDPQGKM